MYVIEFADCDLFDDGQYPVCTRCLKDPSKRSNSEIDPIIHGHSKECVKCHCVSPLKEFDVIHSRYKVSDTCNVCMSIKVEVD